MEERASPMSLCRLIAIALLPVLVALRVVHSEPAPPPKPKPVTNAAPRLRMWRRRRSAI
jgi:hypothetical protein